MRYTEEKIHEAIRRGKRRHYERTGREIGIDPDTLDFIVTTLYWILVPGQHEEIPSSPNPDPEPHSNYVPQDRIDNLRNILLFHGSALLKFQDRNTDIIKVEIRDEGFTTERRDQLAEIVRKCVGIRVTEIQFMRTYPDYRITIGGQEGRIHALQEHVHKGGPTGGPPD